MKAKVLILQTGAVSDPVLSEFGDAKDHFITQKRLQLYDPEVFPIYLDPGAAPSLKNFQAIIVTGSSSMVDENLAWMRQSVEIMQSAIEQQIPLLGVCFGHQLLGKLCQSQVGPHPQGRHHGTTEIKLLHHDDIMPKSSSFSAQISHRDAILTQSPMFKVMAVTDYDPFHAIKVEKSTWGVQFHPEWTIDISRRYVEVREDMLVDNLSEEGYEKIVSSLRPSESASTVIDNFLGFAANCR